LRGYPAIVVGQLAYSLDINGLLIQDAKEDGFPCSSVRGRAHESRRGSTTTFPCSS
jgi:hypothetical protein